MISKVRKVVGDFYASEVNKLQTARDILAMENLAQREMNISQGVSRISTKSQTPLLRPRHT